MVGRVKDVLGSSFGLVFVVQRVLLTPVHQVEVMRLLLVDELLLLLPHGWRRSRKELRRIVLLDGRVAAFDLAACGLGVGLRWSWSDSLCLRSRSQLFASITLSEKALNGYIKCNGLRLRFGNGYIQLFPSTSLKRLALLL